MTVRRWLVSGALALVSLTTPGSAGAAFFDSTACQLFGCALVTNGSEWELYLMTGSAGRPATLWAFGGPGQGVATVRTGSLDRADERPDQNEGTTLGIDLDGDGEADLKIEGGAGDGFLDASDQLQAFPINSQAQVSLAERELRHSFWIASNVPLAIHARARLTERSGELAESHPLGTVEVEIDLDAAGADGVLAYGGGSTIAGFHRDGSIRSLADLVAGPRRLFELERATSTGPTDLRRQLVRVNATYRLAGYDLSQGTGEMGAEVEYFVFNP